MKENTKIDQNDDPVDKVRLFLMQQNPSGLDAIEEGLVAHKKLKKDKSKKQNTN